MKLKSLQINQNLEAMAKQLYDYWFVQFDFPNEEGKPYKSNGGEMIWDESIQRHIPLNWKVQTMESLADFNKQSYGASNLPGKIKYLDTSSLTKNVVAQLQEYDSSDNIPSRARRKVQDLTILYSTVRPSQCHYGILLNPDNDLVVSTGFVTIDAKKIDHVFCLYYYLTAESKTEYLNTIATNSVSAYPSITSNDIAGLSVVMPSEESLIRKFHNYCLTLHTMIENNNKEIETLTKQRDELLPLLMNGQVSVTQLNSDLVLSYIIEDIINQRTMKESIIQSVVMQMQRELDYRQIAHLKEVLAKELQNVEIQELPDKSDSRKQNNKDLLDSFVSAKKIEGCSDKTLIYYRSTIEHLFESVDIMACHIETSDIRQYLVKYQEQKGSSKVTIDNMRRIFSSFFAWLEDEDYIAKSPVRRIHKVKTDSLVKEVLTDEQLEQLRDNCSEKRDLAMIDLLTSTGIRVGELVKLNRKDIDFHERQCVVFGKGSKERMVYFNARTKLHLLNYLAERSDDEEALFVSLSSPHSRLTISGVETRIKELGKRLNMTKVHPHKFRRTMATMAIDKGMPIEQVQKLLGHVRIDTTLRYAIVNQNNVKMAHKKYLG